jgi:DNA-binding protein HU-beta
MPVKEKERWKIRMNKTELVAAVAEKAGLNKKQAEAAVAAFTASVEDALKAGEKVQLIGFGTFEVKAKAARTCRNPKTGEAMQVAASKAPVFKAGAALKDAVK